MQPLPPVDVLDLFVGERASLVDLLGSLAPAEWESSTACPGWSVKDVALHLLGDDVGRLSRGRDGVANPAFGPGLDLDTWDGLVGAIDRQNAAWVEGTRRISPPLLVELLRFTGGLTEEYFRSLDLSAIGGPVDWVGPEPAPVWLDVAREYTERWVHQQHVRDAVGRPGLTERRWLAPVLDTFVRAVPRALRGVPAPDGAALRVVIVGDAGGEWFVVHAGGAWILATGALPKPVATVSFDQDTAWRLFSKGIDAAAARRTATIEGDLAVAERVFEVVAILA
jgi:uncharacterized protein (TIGR03083 family)